MLLCCILDVYLSFLFVCTESLALVSDPTSRRFIRWQLFQTFIYTYIYIYKTQIHARPQIRVLSSNLCLSTNRCPIKLLYPQIRVLLPCRSLSFGIASHSNLCPPKSIFPQICVLHFGRKMTS
jgi:hypothetical protein